MKLHRGCNRYSRKGLRSQDCDGPTDPALPSRGRTSPARKAIGRFLSPLKCERTPPPPISSHAPPGYPLFMDGHQLNRVRRADSLIELVSAGVLIWRFNLELRRGRSIAEMADRTASRIGGALLLVLAAYIGACGHAKGQSSPRRVCWSVSRRSRPCGFCRVRNYGSPRNSESRVLRAGAVESITCRWLSFVVLIRLLAQPALGAWWIGA
jgi:hypothetical protein